MDRRCPKSGKADSRAARIHQHKSAKRLWENKLLLDSRRQCYGTRRAHSGPGSANADYFGIHRASSNNAPDLCAGCRLPKGDKEHPSSHSATRSCVGCLVGRHFVVDGRKREDSPPHLAGEKPANQLSSSDTPGTAVGAHGNVIAITTGRDICHSPRFIKSIRFAT